MFEEAREDVIVTSYVFYEARELLAPLAARCNANPDFRARFIVDLSHQRKHRDEPLPVVANRFRREFLEQFWSGTRAPEFWHDPRVFETEGRRETGVMHAKTVVIDNTAALITSANFTEAEQGRNIEAGVTLRHVHQVERLRKYFERLMTSGHLRQVE
jgi:phosphatidylserine/phosphatidylglycerophosphate/cardiolipin synthase-like enzyme